MFHVNEFNKLWAKMKKVEADSRFIKHDPQAYRNVAQDIRATAGELANMLEVEAVEIAHEEVTNED